MTKAKRILVVEDDITVYPIITRMIKRVNANTEVDYATTAEDAESMLREALGGYDVILSDVHLAGIKSGVDLVNRCYFEIASIPFVMMSGNPDFQSRLPFIAKPYKYPDFFEKLSPYLGENAPTVEERTGKVHITVPKKDMRKEQIFYASVVTLLFVFSILLFGQMEHLPLAATVLR